VEKKKALTSFLLGVATGFFISKKAKASTKEFAKLHGPTKPLKFLHGYFYMRWPKAYVFIHRIGGKIHEIILLNSVDLAKRQLKSTYHGKIVKLSDAESLIKLNKEVSLVDLEQVIPYKHARDIIIKNPDSIGVVDCPCRLSVKNPCLPSNVCLIVGEPYVSFVLEHNTKGARRISKEEALQILREEDERGHIHTAWFKSAMGDRFYAICNCCSCCCAGMKAFKDYGIPMLASSGYVAKIDEENCLNCGLCLATCPFDAIERGSGKPAVNYDKCMGCGLCVTKCGPGAISLSRDSSKGEPLSICELTKI